MFIQVNGGEISREELEAYQNRGIAKYGAQLKGVEVEIDGDEAVLHYHLSDPVPFERVRRITGYLVGTLDKWNDAKRAEERDRVKHGA